MNGYQPITILRILLCLTLGLWLSNTPLPIALADPPVPSPFPTVAPSPFPTAAPPVPPAANPMPIDFTYGPKAGILIHVLLNGKTPATFILDSGFSASCITEEMVKKLGITPKPALGPDGKPIDTIVKNALGVFPSMQIGSISYASIGLVVVTEDQMHLNAITGQPVDGVIGNNILGFLPCFVDFAKNQVTFLYHLPVTTELLQRLGMQDASVCPLTTIMDGSLYVTGVHMVNGSQSDDENLAVDLGSDLSVLPEQAAKKLGLATISQSHYHTPYGNFSLEACLLSSLSFPASGLTVKNQSVSYEKGNLPNGVSGLLGRDVLSQFQVLLDFAAKKMYLKPIAASARSQTTSPQTIIASSAPAMPTSLVSEPTDQPLLQVSFEGKTTGTFLLATLSPLSSLSSDFAAKLGLTPQPAVMGDGKPLMVDGKAAQAVIMPQMHLGNQTLTNFPCLMVSPDNYARAKIPIDGIIGLDVLDDHAFLLDTMKKQITLWGSGTFTQADLKGVDMADAEAVPLTPDGMPAIYSVSGKMTSGKASLTEDLALDTSQPGNFISRDSVALLGLSAVGPPLVIPLQGTIYTIDHTIIPKVSLASLALTDVHTAYADGPVPPGIIQHLGIAFFSQNRVLFDFAHKMMYVKPNLPGTPAATTASAPASAPVTGSH